MPLGSKRYKVVLLGACGSGKSCLTIRYITGRFVAEYDPTISDCYKKIKNWNGKSYLVDIFDTAGTEDLMCANERVIAEGDAFVCTYAIDDERSFEQVLKWYETVKAYQLAARSEEEELDGGFSPVRHLAHHRSIWYESPSSSSSSSSSSPPFSPSSTDLGKVRCPVVLVGCKCDLERRVSTERGMQLASAIGAKFVETSSLTGYNVENVFVEAVRLAKQARKAKKHHHHGKRPDCVVI